MVTKLLAHFVLRRIRRVGDDIASELERVGEEAIEAQLSSGETEGSLEKLNRFIL
jgi:hypothetical protein